MNILAITPARAGSKGLPGKNTKVMCGKPLIKWCVEEVAKSILVNTHVITTDYVGRIQAIVGWENVIGRPDELSTDSAKLIDVLIDVVTREEYTKYDVIVEVLCTNPLFTYKDLDSIITKLIDHKADSVVGVCNAQETHPQRLKWIGDDGILREFEGQEERPNLNRQDYRPLAYKRTAGIIAMTRESLISHGRGGGKRLAYIMPEERCVDIDTEMDFILAEALMKRRMA